LPAFVLAQISPLITINPPPALTCSDPLKGTTLLYVNGQDNEERDIQNALVKLSELINSPQLLLKPKLDKNSKVNLAYVFNPSQGKVGSNGGFDLADFIESAALILQTEFHLPRGDSWVVAYSAFVLGIGTSAVKALIFNQDFVIDERMVEAMEVPFSSLMLAEAEVTDDLKTAIQQHLFAFGEKLILISHSQGNLFVNNAVDELRGSSTVIGNKTYEFDDYLKFIGNAQIATPAGYLELYQKGNYVTNRLDGINKVFTGLPANFPSAGAYIPPSKDDPAYSDYDHKRHHGLLDAYLYGRGSAHAIGLTQQTIQNWVNIAGMLESNCSDKLPKIKITYDTQNPYKLHFDATELANATTGANLSGNFKWSWGDRSADKTAVGAIASHVFPQFLTYEGILEIPLDTGTKIVPFIADLARFTGQTSFLNLNLGLNANNGESPVQSAMDLENNLYYFSTNTGKLISLNATTGDQVSVLPINFQNIKWMSVTSEGNIALVDNSVFGVFTYNILDSHTGSSLLSKQLTGVDVSIVEGFALDAPRNIFYYSIPTSDFSATLVALNSNTGEELAASSNYYYGGPVGDDNTIRLVASSVLINSDGWLIRNGGMYPAAPLGVDNASQYQGLIARWDPAESKIVTTVFPSFFVSNGPMFGIDTNNDLLYTFWGRNDFSGSFFTAIDSRSGDIVYSVPSTNFSPYFSVTNPQVTSDGHMVGTAYVCAETEPCFIGVEHHFALHQVAHIS
jgi:hypothetical protein